MHLAITMEYASSGGRTAASRTLQSVLAKLTAHCVGQRTGAGT